SIVSSSFAEDKKPCSPSFRIKKPILTHSGLFILGKFLNPIPGVTVRAHHLNSQISRPIEIVFLKQADALLRNKKHVRFPTRGSECQLHLERPHQNQAQFVRLNIKLKQRAQKKNEALMPRRGR